MVRLGLASFVGTTRRHDVHHVLRHSTLCCSAGRIASTRRTSLFTLSFLGASHLVRKCCPGGESAFAAATYDKQNLEELVKLFNEAIDISKGEEFAPADESWTKIIDFAPDTSAAWSNRGTFRLQRGKWSEGLGDLEKAIELEGGVDNADGYLVRERERERERVTKSFDNVTDTCFFVFLLLLLLTDEQLRKCSRSDGAV